jgi:hypothetical protein
LLLPEFELEELSDVLDNTPTWLVPTTPDVDVGIAKASAATVTVCLIGPPSFSGESLSSVIVESDESDSASFLSSSVIASIFSIISKASFVSSLESDRRILYYAGAGDCTGCMYCSV